MNGEKLTLSFHGGVRQVTGSSFLIRSSRANILVDCGMRQGCHFCEGGNQRPFPYNPASIDAAIITHAHVDHTGLLPKLVKEGFRGPIFATPPTKAFTELLLEDSAHLIAEEARLEKEAPIYTLDDVSPAIELFKPIHYHERLEVADEAFVTLTNAGHVLGSSSALLEIGGVTVAFSGDLGHSPSNLLPDLEMIEKADYVLVEATYGDRVHEEREERRELLAQAIRQTSERRGVLLIPAFAFGRTQELLVEINTMFEKGRIPKMPVYVDSPMGVKATRIYQRYPEYYRKDVQQRIVDGDLPFQFEGLHFAESVEDSKAINNVRPPKIVIASSGMLQGGRILHHALRYLPDSNSIILFAGYQAAGSLGRRLLAKPKQVRIFDDAVPVRAQIRKINGYSAHADREGILNWLSRLAHSARGIFITHGEEAASLSLKQDIKERFNAHATVPYLDEQTHLSASAKIVELVS